MVEVTAQPRQARLWSPAKDGKVRCNLCAHRCSIADGKRGICGVRENQGGTLYTLVYNRLVARNIDPIEKKPLFHFMPGSMSYSIATAGCNLQCLHCQNFDISQMPRERKVIIGEEVAVTTVVGEAISTGCASISYTYTEPTIFFEYAMDCGVLAHERGLKNAFVTNGFMTKECLAKLRGVLDAANVDLKSFRDDFYKKVCGARLAPVLETIERMVEMGIWVEITTLVIPTLNDSDAELGEIAQWIHALSPSIPWHISAFYPTYKQLDLPATPPSTIERARDIGIDAGLRYVYTGNVISREGEDTFCCECKALLIERSGFTVIKTRIKNSKCGACGAEVHGVGL